MVRDKVPLVKGHRFVNKRICFRIPCSWCSKKIYILLYYNTLLFMCHFAKYTSILYAWVESKSAV